MLFETQRNRACGSHSVLQPIYNRNAVKIFIRGPYCSVVPSSRILIDLLQRNEIEKFLFQLFWQVVSLKYFQKIIKQLLNLVLAGYEKLLRPRFVL